MYNLTKANNRFKKPKDTSGMDLLDFEFFVCRTSVRPTSARCMGPVLIISKALFICNTDLLFEDLFTAPLCFLSSFKVQLSSSMVRNNKLITAACT